MTEQTQLQGYGFVSDNDESLKGKSGGGRFGLNAGTAVMSKFEFSENVAKEGNPVRPAIEAFIKIGDREYKQWFGPINKVFNSDNQEVDPNSPEYPELFNAAIKLQNALVLHYLKALGVSEDVVKATLATPTFSFEEYARKICALVPPGYQTRPLDVFLEYQWNLGTKEDGSLQDRTYPTLPKNMKGGAFLAPAQPGTWTEVRDEKGLHYVNQSGQEHPFRRDKNFMESKKGTQQVAGQEPQGNNPMAGTVTPGNGAAQTSQWKQ